MAGRATAVKRAQMIREVMLDYGVPEVSIEVMEGRPSGTDRWNALNPIAPQSHHIVSNPTPSNPTPGLALVKHGRADLPGPLCNGTAGVDLVYRIITLGWANHPGYGGPLTVRGPLGDFTIPKDNGRPYLWGTEYEGGYSEAVWDRVYTNHRTGKKMSFREFMGRANGALCEAIWLPGVNSHGNYGDITPGMDLSSYHIEHSTWTSRKIDRLGYTTAEGRAEIRRYANTRPIVPQEDDMSAKAEEQIDWIAKRLAGITHDPPRFIMTEEGRRPEKLLGERDGAAIVRQITRLLDPKVFAAAIAAEFPEGSSPDEAALERAVRKVFADAGSDQG